MEPETVGSLDEDKRAAQLFHPRIGEKMYEDHLTAGESHGPRLTLLRECQLVFLDRWAHINAELKRRQGTAVGRMKIKRPS